MRIPKLERNAQYCVTIPALNGGVNQKDAPNLIEDNQLSDACNVWWKEQALRTRPGLYTSRDRTQLLVSSDVTPTADWQYVPNSVRMRIRDKDTVCQAYLTFREGSQTQGSLRLFFVDSLGSFVSQTVVDLASSDATGKLAQSAVVFNDRDVNTLHALLGNGEFVTLVYDDGTGNWSQNRNAEPYIPTVIVNGVGVPEKGEPESRVTGTLFESYNLLGGKFRSLFTTDGKGVYFYLPQTDLDDVDIQIHHTTSTGEVLSYTIPAGETTSVHVDLDGVPEGGYVIANRKDGYILFINTATKAVTMPFVGRNSNLEVIASKTDAAGRGRICAMTSAIWFGGSQSGLSDGTRVFVAGNPNCPSLVHWSDANNPLYFPENNYAYVGDPNGAITALQKQADMLVIFKEWELYSMQYQAGLSFTAEDVVEGRIVDVAAYSATFPLTPIHAEIGCDCPGTICLCHNRLVWASSRGKVYTLVSANLYSAANVRELSAYIEPRLTQHSSYIWQKAHACTFAHWYCLVVMDWMYLLDFDVTGFTSYSSYASAEAAQKSLAWYPWQLHGNGNPTYIPFSVGDALLLAGIRRYRVSESEAGTDSERNAVYLHVFLLLGAEDTQIQQTGTSFGVDSIQFEPQVVSGMFQSKRFDFGHLERRKTIRRLHIGATDAAPGYLALSYITEAGTLTDAFRLGVYGSGAMQEWCVTPGVSRVRQFGIRAESQGSMTVDGMTLRYEFNGEVR